MHTELIKGRGRALDIAPQVDTATTELGAQVHGAHQAASRVHALYLPAVAGTHLPTPRGWRVE